MATGEGARSVLRERLAQCLVLHHRTAGEDKAGDGGSAGFEERAGADVEGGAGGHDVVNEEDAFALDGGGFGEAVGVGGIGETLFAVELGLRGDAGGDAAKDVGATGDFKRFGEGAGEDLGLVVTAAAALFGEHGDGDEEVEGPAEVLIMDDVGCLHQQDEVVGEPEAAAVFEGMDEVFDGTAVAGGDDCPVIGGGMAHAFGADEVGPARQVGFGAADRAAGIAPKGDFGEAVEADVAVVTIDGLPAEEAVARIEEVQYPTERVHNGNPKMPKRTTPKTAPTRIKVMAPSLQNSATAKSATARRNCIQRKPSSGGIRV